MPLYRCTQCGFVTTASRETALAAHDQGSTECTGQIELIADFARQPMMTAPGSRRRRRAGVSAPIEDRPPAAGH